MSYWGNRKPDFGLRCGIDWGHPLARGLVGCWLFNEGAGKQAQSFQNPLALTSGAMWQGSPAGTCANTLGSGNYISTPSTPSISPAEMTYSAICGPVTTGDNTFRVMGAKDCYVDSDGWLLVYWPAYGGRWVFVAGDENFGAYYGETVTPGELHHVTGTIRGTTWTLYNGGRWKATYDHAYTPNARAFNIGCRNGNAGTGQADVNAVLVAATWMYSRALSADEVAWLYTEPYAMIQAPEMPVFYSIPAGGSFNPAWARQHNIFLGGGIQ